MESTWPSSFEIKKRRFRVFAVVLLFALAAVFFLRRELMDCVGWAITVDQDKDIPSDGIAVLLMGDLSGLRASIMSRFLQENPDTVAILGSVMPEAAEAAGLVRPENEISKEYIVAAGIDANRLIMPECHNSSTLEEARCTRTTIQKLFPQAKSLTIITSWYHTSRARWIFERVFENSGIKIYSYVHIDAINTPHYWWHKENSFIYVFTEYLKWTYWLIHHNEVAYTPDVPSS